MGEIIYFPELMKNIDNFLNSFHTISANRKSELENIARYLSILATDNNKIDLNFICTHNSRRSHIAQLWAQLAASYYRINNVNTYSGGTEATAFNERSVKAMRKVGFSIIEIEKGDNPIYQCSFSNEIEPMLAFSKAYNHENNPQSDFIAIMVCSDADEACPIVFGAKQRFSLPFDDPKNYDGTDIEDKMYFERSQQIGTEIFYIFSKVK